MDVGRGCAGLAWVAVAGRCCLGFVGIAHLQTRPRILSPLVLVRSSRWMDVGVGTIRFDAMQRAPRSPSSSLKQHAETLAAYASHPPQRAAVALVTDGSVLAKLNPAARGAARAFHADGGQTPLRAIRVGRSARFGHAALLPVSPDGRNAMENLSEFRRFFA